MLYGYCLIGGDWKLVAQKRGLTVPQMEQVLREIGFPEAIIMGW